jgi:hypothetical protein
MNVIKPISLQKSKIITIVRLMWAKAHRKRVSGFNPGLKAGVMKAKRVKGFSPD